jgi:hypothetical protein
MTTYTYIQEVTENMKYNLTTNFELETTAKLFSRLSLQKFPEYVWEHWFPKNEWHYIVTAWDEIKNVQVTAHCYIRKLKACYSIEILDHVKIADKPLPVPDKKPDQQTDIMSTPFSGVKEI